MFAFVSSMKHTSTVFLCLLLAACSAEPGEDWSEEGSPDADTPTMDASAVEQSDAASANLEVRSAELTDQLLRKFLPPDDRYEAVVEDVEEPQLGASLSRLAEEGYVVTAIVDDGAQWPDNINYSVFGFRPTTDESPFETRTITDDLHNFDSRLMQLARDGFVITCFVEPRLNEDALPQTFSVYAVKAENVAYDFTTRRSSPSQLKVNVEDLASHGYVVTSASQIDDVHFQLLAYRPLVHDADGSRFDVPQITTFVDFVPLSSSASYAITRLFGWRSTVVLSHPETVTSEEEGFWAVAYRATARGNRIETWSPETSFEGLLEHVSSFARQGFVITAAVAFGTTRVLFGSRFDRDVAPTSWQPE